MNIDRRVQVIYSLQSIGKCVFPRNEPLIVKVMLKWPLSVQNDPKIHQECVKWPPSHPPEIAKWPPNSFKVTSKCSKVTSKPASMSAPRDDASRWFGSVNGEWLDCLDSGPKPKSAFDLPPTNWENKSTKSNYSILIRNASCRTPLSYLFMI